MYVSLVIDDVCKLSLARITLWCFSLFVYDLYLKGSYPRKRSNCSLSLSLFYTFMCSFSSQAWQTITFSLKQFFPWISPSMICACFLFKKSDIYSDMCIFISLLCSDPRRGRSSSPPISDCRSIQRQEKARTREGYFWDVSYRTTLLDFGLLFGISKFRVLRLIF